MVSDSTDIHPTPKGTVAKMANYEVSCRFLFIALVLSLPFFIHIKLSVSEMALYCVYVLLPRALYEQRLCIVYGNQAQKAIASY